MILKYESGIEIQPGDGVLYNGLPAEVELVAVSWDDPEALYYMEEFGGGIMINEPSLHGRVFISAGQLADAHELVFIRRRAGT